MTQAAGWTIIEPPKQPPKKESGLGGWTIVAPDAPATAPASAPTAVDPAMFGPDAGMIEHSINGPGSLSANEGLKAVGRMAAQGLTFNYSDEIIAGVRSLLGEKYADALKAEREALQKAREAAGPVGSLILEGAGSMMLPMGGVARLVQHLAGPGASFLKQTAATAAAALPVGTLAAHGAQDEKDLGRAVGSGALGAGVVALGMPLVRGAGWAVNNLGVEPFRRIQEYVHARGANAHIPLPSTQRHAINAVADAAIEGGTRTPIALGNQLAANAVPNTPLALVNTGNDRLGHLALQQAQALKNANVPRMVGGRRVDTNIWDDLARSQEAPVNAAGARMAGSQAEAFRRRVNDALGIPVTSRNPVHMQENLAQQIESGSQRVGDIVSRGNTSVPGFANMLKQSPEAARLYDEAVSTMRIAGGPHYRPLDQIPLRQGSQAYRDAMRAHRRGLGPRPTPLTDENVPLPALANMQAQVSARTQTETPLQRSLNTSLHAALQNATRATGQTNVGHQLTQARAALHQQRTAAEDLAAGRAIFGQDPQPQTTSIVAYKQLAGTPQAIARQSNQRVGYVHGMNDAIDKSANNMGGLAEKFLATPQQRRAYDIIARQGGATGPTAAQLRSELANIGRMQDMSEALRRVSRLRGAEDITAPETAARAYIKYQFQPGAAMAQVAKDWLLGMTQTRRAEIARLLADTTGEGRRLLEAELLRRNRLGTKLTPTARTMLIEEMARQLSQGVGGN